MSKKRQIYIQKSLPEQLTTLLEQMSVPIVKAEGEKSNSLFSFGSEGSNILFSPVKWNTITQSPIGYLNRDIAEWDIPALILKRFFGGEGELGPEGNYRGVLQKSGSLKILEPKSLGYYSDIITSFAVETRVNSTQVRNFTVLILSYLEYLGREDIIHFPIEVDYGITQDSFFLQIHCENKNFYLENILEATGDSSLKDPFVSLLKEALQKVDLLEIYNLQSSEKFVLNACWVHNANFVRTDFYPSLLIHQVKHLKAKSVKIGSVISPKTFFDPDLKNVKKVKVLEALPTKFEEENDSKELVNPVLVKRIYNYIKDRHIKDNYSVHENGYDLSRLDIDVNYFPDKEALKRLNSAEREELVRIILDDAPEIVTQVEEVKANIDTDDYLDGLLNSLKNMSAEEAELVLGGEEDLGEDSSLVRGSSDDTADDINRVGGTPEDLTEEVNRVGGSPDDLTEELTKVSGSKEDLTEELNRIEGAPEDLTEEINKVSGGLLAKEEQNKVIKGSREEKQKNIIVSGEEQKKREEAWTLKRQKVAEKVKGIINDRRLQNASHEEIDSEVKAIIKEELGIDEEKSQKLVSNISDTASDEWVRGGIDTVNENIKQRIKIEKMSNQLSLREKQVEKMKNLISSLKNELGAAKKELLVSNQSVLSNPDASGDLEDSLLTLPDNVRKTEQQQVIANQIEKINELRDATSEVDEKVATLEEENKELVNKFKAKSAEDEREIQKLKNELFKATEENTILQRKVKEGIEEVADIRDSDEDTEAVLKENENLKAQVESLKKRMNFMYENSKANKEIAVSASEVQKIIEDKERFFEEKVSATKEIDSLKADLREQVRVIKQKDLELKQKDDLLKGRSTGGESDELIQLKKSLDEEKQSSTKLATDLKAAQIKAKSFEQKVKFMTAQLDKYTATASKANGTGPRGASVADPKVAAKLKQTETMNIRLKEAGEKLQKELQEKKGELHKANLERKTLELKVRDLEKKLSVATGKKKVA